MSVICSRPGSPTSALREMKTAGESSIRATGTCSSGMPRRCSTLGDYDAAYDWLTKTLADNAGRLPYEEDNLRSTVAGFLQQQGRYAELADYLAKWIERSSENAVGLSAVSLGA